MTLISKARTFATQKHEGQVRKCSGLPYIVHPEAVVNTLRQHHDMWDQNLLAAAWLHDTLEDTQTSYEELEDEFNEDVANLVSMVSHPLSVKYLKRAERWPIYLYQSANSSRRAKALKLADRLCNITDYVNDWSSMPKREKYFVKHVYFNESVELLRALRPANLELSGRLDDKLMTLKGLRYDI